MFEINEYILYLHDRHTTIYTTKLFFFIEMYIPICKSISENKYSDVSNYNIILRERRWKK